MREIKFRAWMVQNKVILDWNDLQNKMSAEIPIFDQEEQGLILMQFTGLKDKNGVEIYEGDILENSDWVPDAHCENPLGKSVIEWENDLPGFKGIIGETIRVVGNIYENPELLKGI